MGLIKAALGAAGGALGDQWLEFFVCESMEADVLAAKGQKKTGKRSSNTKGEDNIISDGSGVVVNKGQAALIIADGKIADICAEEGSYTFNAASEPSVFYGGFGKGLAGLLGSMGDRIKHGGIPAKDHRIYYFNTKEIMGNKYGTPQPIPYLIVDPNINLRLTISLRANGEYSYRIINPAAFYANVCGNVEDLYTRDKLDSQLRSEIVTALGPALAKLGAGLEYHQIPAMADQLSAVLNEALTAKWRDGRGLEIVNFGISVAAPKEDEDRIKQLQTTAVMRDPTMAAATLVNAQSDAMRTAAGNPNGAMMGFMGMGMAAQAGGMNPQALFQMGQQQTGQQQQTGAPGGGVPPQGAPAAPGAGWTCSCGHTGNTGKFCADCGKSKPESGAGWTCSCGASNGGKFCASCGKPKPAGTPAYRCDKCGWEPPDPKNPPKFCPECGDLFDEKDIKQ
jgi:membrane protease subunit (stomatin/prohibitin family)